MFFGQQAQGPQSSPDQASQHRSFKSSPPQRPAYQPEPNELIKLFRDKIKARGARGIIGL
jgi:hypothetical protein